MCRMRAALTVLAAVLAASVPVAQMNTGELGGVVQDESGYEVAANTDSLAHLFQRNPVSRSWPGTTALPGVDSREGNTEISGQGLL